VKAYVVTSGMLFGIVTVAHVWRMIEEGRSVASSPWYLAITILTAALAAWAWRVARGGARS
jgi:hypothetical protein